MEEEYCVYLLMSLAREAWIEIQICLNDCSEIKMSLAREAWIEILRDGMAKREDY